MSGFVDLLEKAFDCNYPQYKGTGTSNISTISGN